MNATAKNSESKIAIISIAAGYRLYSEMQFLSVRPGG
jgi:hypothetical protein